MTELATIERDDVTPRGNDKITHYGWVIRNSPGTMDNIPKNSLVIGAEYQREANRAKVLEIAGAWDWLACGAVVVAKVSGKFRVIDGQHRVLAARKRSDIDTLPCLIFQTAGIAEEARGFLALNTLNKPVSAIDKHKARLIAEEPVALKIQRTLDRLGLNLSKTASGPGQFGAIAWANRRAVEDYENFDRLMGTLADITRDAGVPVAEKLADGLWYLDRHLSGGIYERRVIERIKHVGAEKLLDGALRASAYFARGGARVFATGMLEVLNKGLHRKIELNGPE